MARGLKRDAPKAGMRFVRRPEDGAHLILWCGKLFAFRHPSGEATGPWQVWHRHRYVDASREEAEAFDALARESTGG